MLSKNHVIANIMQIYLFVVRNQEIIEVITTKEKVL